MDPNPNIPPKPPQLPPPDPPATPPSDPDPAPDPSAGANGDGDGDKLAAPAGIGAAAQMLLRDPVALLNWLKGGAPLAGKLAAVALAGFALFGVVVGLFSLGDQLWAAPVKVVAGTFFAALICLPSLYIFAALAGAEAKPGALLAALVPRSRCAPSCWRASRRSSGSSPCRRTPRSSWASFAWSPGSSASASAWASSARRAGSSARAALTTCASGCSSSPSSPSR
ncbi:MAG: hypothetical protein R3F11_31970 [Verrucomicrobiales bacterium]